MPDATPQLIEGMRYYVSFQDFDSEIARVGEAPTLEAAIQIALAVYAKPPTAFDAKRNALKQGHVIRDYEISEPVVAVYDRQASQYGEQVFWLGCTWE
ncbi:MAG TPA: hypothetical protein VFB50_13995 [Chloroflexota bacterium]|nr:hypothetical protein [Chloroflexota bacterium]